MSYLRSFSLFALLLFMSCSNSPKQSIDTVFEDYFQERLKFNPIESTIAGGLIYNDTLPNLITDEYLDKLLSFYQKYQGELKQFESSELTSAQSISRDVLLWELDIKIEGLQNELTLVTSPLFGLPIIDVLPINQIFSLHLFIGQLGSGSSAQPFKTVQDYDNWLSRMEDYFDFLDSTMDKMSEGIEIGVVHPKIITTRMIAQLDNFITTPYENHVFYQPIGLMPEDISDAEKERLSAAYQDMVVNDLVPKYKELQDFLRDTYLPVGVEASGIGAFPNGKETYEYLVRIHTSTTMTPDEIHELGLSEVARIEGEMETCPLLCIPKA